MLNKYNNILDDGKLYSAACNKYIDIFGLYYVLSDISTIIIF